MSGRRPAWVRRSMWMLELVLNAGPAVLGLVVLSPVLLVVAILVRLEDAGPVLFRQQRIGRYGRPFTILKFRTMRVGAERELQGLLAQDGRSITAFVKLTHDPRVTGIGRVLRATSLDELPQLVNVLRRDMNLVGPRPQTLAEVETYGDVTWRRLLVRPGVTGLWQVSGRSDLDVDSALQLDDFYVRRRSWWLDVALVARTVRVVLVRRGAV